MLMALLYVPVPSKAFDKYGKSSQDLNTLIANYLIYDCVPFIMQSGLGAVITFSQWNDHYALD